MFAALMNWLDALHNKYAVMMLTAATGFAGYEWISWSRLSASDWGTWIGAVCTALALAVTIVIATQSARQRRKEQIDLALIHAAQLFIWIAAVQGALRSAVEYLPASLPEEDPRAVFLQCSEILEAAGMWSSADLAPLFLVPDHTAAKLAAIKIRIENTKTSLKKTGTGAPFPPTRIGP